MRRNLLLLLLLLLATAQVWGQCTPLVYDDFESGAMHPSWVQGGAYTRTYPTAGAPQGTTFLQQAGSSSHYAGSVLNFGTSTPSYISWWAQTSTNANNCSYVVVGDASTSTNNGIVFSYFTSSGTLRFYNNTANWEMSTTANTWYHVELMNINFTTKTFDLYINSVLVQSGYAFRSTGSTSVDQIHLYNYDTGSTGYYDEVIVGAAPLLATYAQTPPACALDTNGTATVTVTSGQSPYTYLWGNGATTPSLSGLGAGTYVCTVTAGNGCTLTDSVTIAAPSPLVDTLAWTDPSCATTTDGSIDLTVAGGTPGYSYLWSTGDSTADLTGLGGGTYYVDFVDTNGCAGSDTVTLVQPTAISLVGGPANILCFGQVNGAISTTTSGGTPGYSYLWSTGDSTADILGLAAGTYSVTVTDANGCMVADSFTITEPAALQSVTSVVTPDNGGGNGAIDLIVTGGTGPFTYAWSTGATTEDLSGLVTGTYTVTITDANFCTLVSTFVVDLVIGVGNVDALAVQAWPIPFGDHLKLQLPTVVEAVQVVLYDLRGVVMLQQTMAGGTVLELDTRSIAAGCYLLHVRSGDAQRTLRVSKLH